MWADFHWHARDWQESHKETVKRSLELAYVSGGLAIGAMPNTQPALNTLDICRDYLKLADGITVPNEKRMIPVQLYVHIGLTADLEQVKCAVEATRKEPGICGMKVYWGSSTGTLGIFRTEDQYNVLETLAKEGYTGVVVSHCEKEELLHDDTYDPQYPETWSTLCRPERAEIVSFQELVGYAEKVNFCGKIHVAHVSTLPVVDLVAAYQGPLQLSCGVTPHHLFLDSNYLNREDGAWYKCNPPLRNKETQQGLLERVMQGKIPIIESDHAPHTVEDKQKILPASGIASGLLWPETIANLKSNGMNQQQLKAVCFENAVTLYGLQERIRYEERKIQPQVLEKLQSEYPYRSFANFFSRGNSRDNSRGDSHES